MKRRSICIIMVAALAVFAACTDPIESIFQNRRNNVTTLTAMTEQPGTKTTVVSGTHVYWEPGDEIAVFTDDTSGRFVTNLTEPSGTAVFEGVLPDPDGSNTIWAVYPYSKDAMLDRETGTLIAVLPSTQVARAGSFGKDVNLSVARTNRDYLQFYNVGGGVCFTVTEEGIKKVMFEGLNGELLSGAVRIGFDDAGLPVVNGITGGSQFITLLPPEGETFQPNTWYYIVALPGALEKGYKMRFYKSDTYARRLTETSVMIKRSTYGDVENADGGLTYEATTTKFPETEEEWEESESRIEDVAPIFHMVLNNVQHNNEGSLSGIEVVEEIKKVEGVVSADLSQSGDVIRTQMQDGVFINVLINSPIVEPGFVFHGQDGDQDQDQDDSHNQLETQSFSVQSGSVVQKKALVLIPVYSQVLSVFDKCWGAKDHAIRLYRSIVSSLEACGYNVDAFYNYDATLEKFRGKNMQQYDVVYINTHGVKDAVLANGETTTAWLTMTPITDHSARRFFSVPSYCLWAETDSLYYWFTTDALKYDSPLFNNTWIFAHTCESLANEDMSSYFLERGAAAYTGFMKPASMQLSVDMAVAMVNACTNGMEILEATNWARNNAMDLNGNFWIKEYMDMLFFSSRRRNDISSYTLFDPHPYDLSNSIKGNQVTFRWKLPKHSGRNSYRIYVNDSPIGPAVFEDGSTDYSYTYTSKEVGYHTWFVENRIIMNGEVVETIRSSKANFTVSDNYPTNCPSNQIWYTTDRGELVYLQSDFDVNIVSHKYESGQGVITFSQSLKTISSRVFYGCSDLTSIALPEGLTSIGDSAFVDCRGLTTIPIPSSVTSIGKGAFSLCRGLTSITIPKGVTKISDVTFAYCEGLTSIIIPSGVTSIGSYAFSECKGLTSITIPKGVTKIDYAAFAGCTSLTSITILATNPPIGHDTMFLRTNNCPIYVPAASVEAYKTADQWSFYADRIRSL